MDNTFLTWLIGALVVGLGLLLILGLPGGEEVTVSEAADAGAMPVASSAAYWEPVATGTSASAIGTAWGPVGDEGPAPCSSCGASTTQTAWVQSVVAPTASPLAGGCGMPVQPCAAAPCATQRSTCTSTCPTSSCGTACSPMCGARPQINRNMPLCVDECSFIQLHSSVPQPTCRGLRFEWSASRGGFVDPTAGDPLYYAPTSYFPNGENVWITLTVVDSQGIRYTDQIQLHVNNVR